MEPRLQASAYELLLDRRVGKYKLPDNVWVVAAGNLPEDGALAYEINSALADRLVHFRCVSDVQEWLAWGLKNGIAMEVLSFMQIKGDHLDAGSGITSLTASGSRGANSGDKIINPTPRSWFRVSQLMKQEIKREVLEYIIPGIVGDSSAAEFFTIMDEMEGLAPVKDILKASDAQLPHLLPTKIAPMAGLAYAMPAYCDTIEDFRRAMHVFTILSEMDEAPSRAEIQTLAMSLLFLKISQKTKGDRNFIAKIGATKEYAIYREKAQDIIDLYGTGGSI